MKNDVLYYSVGPLLYCPANKENIAELVLNNSLGVNFSLALCLEDTINDDFLLSAEKTLIDSITKIYNYSQAQDFYLPKIFIRVRCHEQITKITKALGESISIITGFIIPKFDCNNASKYINSVIKANELAAKKLYMMPIYESASIIDLRNRHEILYALKQELSQAEELVLNIRVGGNDLCHIFGFRRHFDESIHSIRPIADIFSDIITVYGMDYVISGPVWEYYSGTNWKEGLKQELAQDKLCGFVGKTVIHPNQISIVNQAYKVSAADYADALSILNWDKNSEKLVSGSVQKERMNEYKTHSNWAMQILYLAQTYGIE